MNPDYFLRIEHVSAGYPQKNVLKDVSFSVNKGTITGLLGANGCGKTTLIKAICNLVSHTGECFLDNAPLSGLNTRKLSRLISYIPQKSGISISFTVLEVVLMGFNPVLKPLEYPNSQQKKVALDSLNLFGILHLAHTSYENCSEGEKQLSILARTFVQNTKLLLLDEPDSALDFQNRYRMMNALVKLTEQKEQSALICLHDPQLALSYCDRLILLQDGQCSAILNPGKDSHDYMEAALSKIYGPLTLQQVKSKTDRNRLVLLSDISK